MPETPQGPRWQPGARDPDAYDARWQELAAEGGSVHGEAELVGSLAPARVLDAGCGTGRVAIELARRGIDVVGVDVDDRMLASARGKAPGVTVVTADLAHLDDDDVPGPFDIVVLAGNVMIFLEPGTEAAVVAALTARLAPSGRLVAGFQLGGRRFGLDDYDAAAQAAGLALEHRWATWERDAFVVGGDYAVSLHRRSSER